MPIEITVRHEKANEADRQYAEKRAAHLIEKLKRVDNVRVVLDRQRHLFEAELIVEQKGHILAEAKEHAESSTAAIDTAVARVMKQVQKAKSKHDKAIVHQQKHV
ncbi:MAG: HPF/RaiA family ribosome-associated protein [Kiritimatiellaeota bacterium]|nr:HPF/RaiA family ribosome-associated protein [Kiritimatiellota bacterium]